MILPAPMLLSEGKRPPPVDQPGWLYEIKFDGYRLIAGINAGDVHLATRNGSDATNWFPEIVQGLARLSGGRTSWTEKFVCSTSVAEATSIGSRTGRGVASGTRVRIPQFFTRLTCLPVMAGR
jgi:hypothetical protein